MIQQKGTVTGLIAITGDDGGSDDVGSVGERIYNYREMGLQPKSPKLSDVLIGPEKY